MISKYSNGEITSGQSYIIIVSIMVGTGVLGLARSVATISQQDAWISVLINGIGISLVMGIIISVISKFPNCTFFQYTSFLLSKPLAYGTAFLYGIYSVITTALVVRYLSEMVGTWYLPRTPMIVVSFLTVSTLVYLTKDGLTLVGRFNEIVVFSIVPFIFLVFPSLSEATLLNLKPVGGAGIVNIVKGVIPSFYAFGGYESILFIYPFIANKTKNNLKYSVLSVMFVTILYTTIVASQIALFGHQEITDILYSFINYLDVLDFPIIERIEIFFTFFWTFAVLGTLTIQYIAGCIAFQGITKSKKVNVFVYLFAPIIFFLSLFPKNSAQVVTFSDIVGKASIGFGIVLPILLLLMYMIKRKVVNHEKGI